MIANQLDWFPSNKVQDLTLNIYDLMLDSQYRGWVSRIALPKSLPALCGGLGLPHRGKQLPYRELSYARFIRWLTNQPRTFESVKELLRLRSLGGRIRYGIQPGPVPDYLIHEFVKYYLVPDDLVDFN